MEEKDEECMIMVNKRYVAPLGGNTTKMSLPPAREAHRSKRYDGCMDVAQNLVHNREFLRQQAIKKDRLFKRNVLQLRERINRFQLRVEKERKEREIQEKIVDEEFREAIESVQAMFVKELRTSVAKVEEEWLPPPIKRIDEWKNEFDYFVNVTIPETIENQSGRVTRHLIKSQETFEIDNIKLWKREMKIVSRFEYHQKNSLAIRQELTKKRIACFVLLDEESEEHTRSADKAEEQFQHNVIERIYQVQQMESGLAGVRQETDSVILVAIEEAMRRIQQNVLQNFGMSKEAKVPIQHMFDDKKKRGK